MKTVPTRDIENVLLGLNSIFLMDNGHPYGNALEM